jgi:hypothetical protein
VIIFFARRGEPLGNLNYKTDKIHLMSSPDKEIFDKFWKQIESDDDCKSVNPDINPLNVLTSWRTHIENIHFTQVNPTYTLSDAWKDERKLIKNLETNLHKVIETGKKEGWLD